MQSVAWGRLSLNAAPFDHPPSSAPILVSGYSLNCNHRDGFVRMRGHLVSRTVGSWNPTLYAPAGTEGLPVRGLHSRPPGRVSDSTCPRSVDRGCLGRRAGDHEAERIAFSGTRPPGADSSPDGIPSRHPGWRGIHGGNPTAGPCRSPAGAAAPPCARSWATSDAMQLAIGPGPASSDAGWGRASDGDPQDPSWKKTHHHTIAGVLRTGVRTGSGPTTTNPCGDFVPPPPEHVRHLLRGPVRGPSARALPLRQAALVPPAVRDHSFPSTNCKRRTGRASSNLVLRRRGIGRPAYVPISVVAC